MLRKITDNVRHILRNTILAVLSGVLGFLAFPPFEIAVLGWVCLVPLLVIARSARPKDAFLYAFLAGAVFFGCLLYWLVNVTIPGMIILVFALSVVYGLFGFAAAYVFRHAINLLLLPFVWVALEYMRSCIFTGFPWGLLGCSQYKNINLIQIADLTGAYGVSFLLVIFNVAMFAFLFRSKKRITYMMIALLFIIMAVTYGRYRSDNYYILGSPRVSVVQGNIPQRLKWDPAAAENIIEKYSSLTKKAAEEKPAMIVWPETSYPRLYEKPDDPRGEISTLAAETGIPILAGIICAEGDDLYNGAVLFNGKKTVAGTYFKTHLVPFGEYVPFERYLFSFREYIDKPIGDFGRGTEYTLFSMRSLTSKTADGARIRQTDFYKFGVMICFEDIFPYIAREFVRKGADFLVNITNDAWFGRTAAARQHLQASVFRAVENRVPVVRAANTGISCFIDPSGMVTSKVARDGSEISVEGLATDNINITAGRSFYTKHGDVFVYFCIFMIVFLVIAERFFVRKQGRDTEK